MKQYTWKFGLYGFGRAHRLGRLVVVPDKADPQRSWNYTYYNLGVGQLRVKTRL